MSVLPAKLFRRRKIGAFLRRRWPLATVLLALLASGSAMVGSGGTAALARALEDPLSLLADRSPGSRAEGALFATKHPKVVQDAVDAVLPVARERTPQMAELPVLDTSAPAIGIDPLLVPVQAGAPTPAAPEIAAFVPPGPIIGGSTPGIIIPTGGDPGSPPSNPPDTPTDPEPPVVPPAVPEPSTWAMMILGFFMVGATLRAKANAAAVHGAG